MSNAQRIRRARSVLLVTCLSVLPLTGQTKPDDASIRELEAFIAEESRHNALGGLDPASRTVDHVFLKGMSLMEVPRAVTVVNPETMKQLRIETFDDLDKAGAGLSRPNFYGLAGAPFIRGEEAGVYFNGMLRAYNRNERPTSFGSLDAMDIVKGPAPAHFGPTNAGGYVNFIPKSPYFDQPRGSVNVQIGMYDSYRAQFDVGGPLLVNDTPMAYRLSVTGQLSGSYFDHIRKDYLSAYASAKTRLNERVSLFFGSEVFRFQTNENAGWNRLTQELIDAGRYVVGEPDPNNINRNPPWNGTADRQGPFGSTLKSELVVPVTLFQNRFGSPDGDDGIRYLNNPAAAAATPIFDPDTEALFGYQYTDAYFANGGEVFTTILRPNQVLSDPDDFADSVNALAFWDTDIKTDSDWLFTNKFFFEYVDTEKISSYGYAMFTENLLLENSFVADFLAEPRWARVHGTLGASIRFSNSSRLQDFSSEPFNRRDLSTGTIPPGSIVIAGPQADWKFGGHNESDLWQFGLSGMGVFEWNPQLSTVLAGRVEHAVFDWRLPEESQLDPAGQSGSGDKTYGSFSISPLYRVNEALSLFGNLQYGTVFNPSQSGDISGDSAFNQSELYELGLRGNLFDETLYFSAAAYYYDRVTLTETPLGQDANATRGQGFEFESYITPTERLKILFHLTAQQSRYRGSLPFRTVPLTEEQVALGGGAIQLGFDPRFPEVDPAGPDGANPDTEKVGYPQLATNLFLIYEWENGFGLGAGPTWRDGFRGNIEGTLKYPSATIWNANLFYRKAGWELFLRLNNFTDTFYFYGNEGDFSANTVSTPGEPFTAQLSVTRFF
jgi:iron complex outermembrane receptor protein